MLLEVKNLKKYFPVGHKKLLRAVDDVTLSIEKGETLGLVGESGCGKSTLCRILTGVEKPTSGEVLLSGRPVRAKENRGRMQMVFQNSFEAVNPGLNIGGILSEPLENLFHMTKRERLLRTGELMEQVGLSAQDLKKYPRQFSGGQLQRICIARALAAKPEVLILDEPLSSLDLSVQAQILNLLAGLKSEQNLTYVLVSHNLKAVYYLADELTVMSEGKIEKKSCSLPQFRIQ